MRKEYSIYKGLQKPLVYKGFKGKYVYWALATVISGVMLGGLISAILGIMAGAFTMAIIFCGGISYTSQEQRKGLHNKNKEQGYFVHQTNLNGYGKKKNI